MKFSDRSALERTAIDAWIRVSLMVREDECLKVADNFKQVREAKISESEIPGAIAKMLRFYEVYQTSRPMVSYTQFFRVSNPEEYAAMVIDETQIA